MTTPLLSRKQVDDWRNIAEGFFDPAAKEEFDKVIDYALAHLDSQLSAVCAVCKGTKKIDVLLNGTRYLQYADCPICQLHPVPDHTNPVSGSEA